MDIFIGIVALILLGIIVYAVAKRAYTFYRLLRRTGKSINRYIESE